MEDKLKKFIMFNIRQLNVSPRDFLEVTDVIDLFKEMLKIMEEEKQ